MEALARYAVQDEYIVQEMVLLYKAANPQKRIELLSDWYGPLSWGLPFEVAKLVVEDPDDGVRYWMARNASDLDYRPRDPQTGERDDTQSERNLEARLRADPVPMIRASVLENRELCDRRDIHPRNEQAGQSFTAMSHLERLALMRNPDVTVFLAQSFADLQHDVALVPIDLPLDERKELLLALLTNRAFVERSHSARHGEMQFDFAKLWDAISRWPREYPEDARFEFFRRIYAPGDKKAEIYKASESERVRLAILEGCDGNDPDAWGVLELGTTDTDPACRELAYSKLPVGMVRNKLRKVLRGLGLPSTSARYRAYALASFWALLFFGLSLSLLIPARGGQLALLSLLTITCCLLIILGDALDYQLEVAEYRAGQRLNELKKLFGAKDLAQSESETRAAERLWQLQESISIRRYGLGAAGLVAFSGLIRAVLQ